MTRFARARGSKASNERIPGDGTPWDVMKEQFLQAQKKGSDTKCQEEAEQKRIENYENFLKEQKILKRKSVWCEFEDGDVTKSQIINENQHLIHTKKKKNKKHNNEKQNLNVDDKNKTDSDNVAEINPEAKSNKIESDQIEEQETETKKKEKRDKKKKLNQDAEDTMKEDNFKLKNKKKRNHDQQSLDHQSEDTQNDKLSEVDSQANPKQKKKKDKNIPLQSGFKDDSDKSQNHPDNGNHIEGKNLDKTNKKNKKLVNGKPPRRKVLNDKSFELIINGKEVHLVRFDGFPIMKKDAERLEDLKKNMIKKGIPKSEVQRTMKLERRRAEKALARIKRDVCYNCRKGGHNLSDCPDLKSKIPGADGADGLCFKCGSTEHRQFECKVQKDKEFRFATCFICKEPGHIARQCPDNPKGLYPNGGCCKLCGDVTHLRKDCPTVQDKREGSSVKLNTLDATENIEDIGGQTSQESVKEPIKKPKKIKF